MSSEADVEVVQEALEYQEQNSLMGPLFPEALQALTRISDRLQRYEAALREIISLMPPGEVNGRAYSDARDIAEEYITTGRVQE